jgi:dTDP-4-dehydrorhamnose reductase
LRFLVIGAGGLVGRHIRSAAAGHDVIATYRDAARVGDLSLDIRDTDAAQRAVIQTAPDVVVLAAADAWVERCELEPELTRQVNVEAASVIAMSSNRIGALLVVFSSEYVFDGTQGEYSEEDDRRPLNEYGRQKVALENLALRGGPGLVCRTSAVFGDDPRRKNFVCQLVDTLRSRQVFNVPSDQIVTPTYAPSMAKAVVSLAELRSTGIFHVAGPEVMSRAQFARTVAEAYRLDASLLRMKPTSELALVAPRPARCGLRTDKLWRVLGTKLSSASVALAEMAAR